MIFQHKDLKSVNLPNQTIFGLCPFDELIKKSGFSLVIDLAHSLLLAKSFSVTVLVHGWKEGIILGYISLIKSDLLVVTYYL